MNRRTNVRLTPRRRHLAAIVTIALSAGFVAVMALAGGLVTNITRGGLEEQYAGADLAVDVPPDEDADPEEPPSPPDVPSSQAVWSGTSSFLSIEAPDGDETFADLREDPPAAVHETPLVEGHDATEADEVVLGEDLADSLGTGIGDRVIIDAEQLPDPSDGDAELTVVGIAEAGGSGLFGPTGTIHVNEANQDRLLDTWYTSTWLVALDPGADPQTVIDDLAADGIDAQTAEEAIDRTAQENMAGFGAMGMLLAVFVVIALVTSAVVISNTFAVTIAQRTRALALLRTVGASKHQVGGIVLRESFAVGLIGALIGTVGAHLLVQAGLLAAPALGLLDSTMVVPISLTSVALPLITGVVVTTLAGIGPMRTATRVAPLEAMRPATVAAHRGLGARGVLALVAVVVGLLALAVGVALSLGGSASLGILLGIFGGVVSFAGVLIGLGVLTRPLTRLVSAVAGRIGGLPAKIAGANVARNPRRSSATIAALVIGTTLMTMMAVGARTAEDTLVTELESRKPIDLVATGEQIPTEAADELGDVQGIDTVEETSRGDIDVGVTEPMTLYALAPAQIEKTSNRPELADQVRDDVVLLGEERAGEFGVTNGQVMEVEGADGATHEIRFQVESNLQMSVVTPSTLETLVGEDTSDVLTAKFADPDSADRAGVAAIDILSDAQQTLEDAGVQDLNVDSGGVEKESNGQILSVLLGITIALLAVAVVVALVGVASTLSLGVIERNGENALLRALGTTRSQMRRMLSWEGLMLALVGAVLGLVIGSIYGVLGIYTLLGADFPVTITIPWGQLAAVLVLSVLAGWAASVLPGNRAARTAPAQALASAD